LLQSEYGKLATDTSFEEWVRGNPAQAHEALEIGLAECGRSDLLNDSDTMGALTNELLNLASPVTASASAAPQPSSGSTFAAGQRSQKLKLTSEQEALAAELKIFLKKCTWMRWRTQLWVILCVRG